ncbi:MAG: ArsR/SmtB family transcription factor [Pseudonocardiaceae bacterium]
MLTTLASPQRLRIFAALVGGRRYVSELAREVGLSRPLVSAHLRKLAAAGLIESQMELSEEGQAMRYVQVKPFSLYLTPELIAEAVQTLTITDRQSGHTTEESS